MTFSAYKCVCWGVPWWGLTHFFFLEQARVCTMNETWEMTLCPSWSSGLRCPDLPLWMHRGALWPALKLREDRGRCLWNAQLFPKSTARFVPTLLAPLLSLCPWTMPLADPVFHWEFSVSREMPTCQHKAERLALLAEPGAAASGGGMPTLNRANKLDQLWLWAGQVSPLFWKGWGGVGRIWQGSMSCRESVFLYLLDLVKKRLGD